MTQVFVWTPADIFGLACIAIIVCACFVGLAIEASERVISWARKIFKRGA